MYKKKQAIVTLLYIYRQVISYGAFCRRKATRYCRLKPYICEGRWYAELKRVKRYGVVYDWKTMLVIIVKTYSPLAIDKVQFERFIIQIQNAVILMTGFNYFNDNGLYKYVLQQYIELRQQTNFVIQEIEEQLHNGDRTSGLGTEYDILPRHLQLKDNQSDRLYVVFPPVSNRANNTPPIHHVGQNYYNSGEQSFQFENLNNEFV